MPKGKKTCEILRKVRQQVADANGIAYTPAVCTHKGECAGTCPVCERERQYIEMQLASKAKKGKALKIVGIAAGLSSNKSFNGNIMTLQWEWWDLLQQI